jgi:hypothetical protein
VPFGRILIIVGLMFIALGLLAQFGPMFRFGRLPGDLSFGGNNWRVYVPIGTSILLSIVLTLVLTFVNYVMTRR